MYPDESTQPTIMPSNTKLTVYNGAPLRQHGKFNLHLSNNDHEVTATFYIVETNGPILIGMPTSRDLRLVTMHCSIDK